MATTPSQQQSELALVSSLYGPGTITCWYLTTLSLLVSWTLHPRKRRSGSIDADLIAVLTLPAVAAVHLITQVRAFIHQDEIVRASSSVHWKYQQSVAAIEAPFNVTETFMAISVILFIAATWALCIRRSIFVASIGLLCFTVECYIHFSKFTALDLRYKPGVSVDNYPGFSRFFVTDFAGLVIAILVILSLCGLISTAIAFYMLLPSRTESLHPRHDDERGNEEAHGERTPYLLRALAARGTRSAETTDGTQLPRRPDETRAFSIVAALILPLAGVMTAFPSAFSLAWSSINHQDSTSATASVWQTIEASINRLVRGLFPRTACSFTDLDQGVAAAAGATVLGFSIYSVAKAYYTIWTRNKTTSLESTGTELGRIENRPIS